MSITDVLDDEENTMKDWMKLIPEADVQTYLRGGLLADIKFGKRPALIVVDVIYGFTGSEGQTLEESIAEFSTACGPVSWETMPRIAQLIGLFRELNLPIVFTNSAAEDLGFTGRTTKRKPRARDEVKYNQFPPAIAPKDGEWVLGKTKASAFFQTPLTAYLVKQGVDTAVVCGVSTSGCVRATTVDAHSHGFTTFLIDDCCFDRSYFAHAANLFDMQAKYAAVISLDELAALLKPIRKASAA
jgi:maleamate amidohydrolase